ncbi:dGTPase [Yersinia enterocolitica]|nr:dGTPase [Yersinia enterocolitica]EKN3994442.1 dGTPase [Yersinia enterocolitica]EKN5083415.1 dNTP triphosphohydrolase [Yersinia enterocolitica]EKN6400325.1 dNTP triphosphohydrolase [Yersinia enterocolitica]EKP3833014.1 dGTPase [Yersinia enterocolitica]
MSHSNSDKWAQRRGSNDRRAAEIRTEWKRDLSRLIHSSPFRRLQSKTQVLGLGESDFYRTRLTHSMEVAQIGDGLLCQLELKYADKEESQYLPDHDLMQAICLAHDIGHPPFGHGGEVALNFCMKEFDGFEGNGQTLRILSRLDKYTANHGLDPTRRLLLGVLKYPVSYSSLVNENVYQATDVTSQNWLFKSSVFKPPKCYLDSEADVVDYALELFTPEDRQLFTEVKPLTDSDDVPSHRKAAYKALDTTIMDLADEISYSLHDLEDAISLGMITRSMWTDHFRESEHLFDSCKGTTFTGSVDSVADSLFGESYRRKECIGMLVHLMITSVILDTQNEQFKSGMLRYKAVLPPEIEALRKAIFDLVMIEVIRHENVQLLEFKGQKLIVELFGVLASDPQRFLSRSTRDIYEQQAKTGQKEGMRVICDFVSGMTDDYATRLYEKIFVPNKGSIFDRM